MTPDDPRHGTSAGYQAHLKDREDACDACSEANYRARKRILCDKLRGEQMFYTAEEVRDLIRPWRDMGLTLCAISVAAGMDTQRGANFARVIERGGVIRRGTFNRLAAITEDDFAPKAKVYADLTRRRVYSLMAIGHRLIDMPINPGGHWRTRSHITVATARDVRAYYAAHEFEIGPDQHTMARARNAGHVPPLGWDDPGTLAWPSPDGRKRPKMREPKVRLDEVVVWQLLAGEHVRATRAEKDEAMRRWKAMGRSERSLCEIHGWKAARYGRGDAA